MDLNAYPNLAAIGLMKEAALNKGIYRNLQEHLSLISYEEFSRIDSELPYYSQQIVNNMIITPTAIIKLDGLGKKKYISDIILSRNFVYVYGSTTTMRMNFIPYNKMHTLNIFTRDGKCFSSNPINTGGFSKKDVIGPIINQISGLVDQYYPGILYGWTKEREQAMLKNPAALVQAVDQNRMAAQQQGGMYQ